MAFYVLQHAKFGKSDFTKIVAFIIIFYIYLGDDCQKRKTLEIDIKSYLLKLGNKQQHKI